MYQEGRLEEVCKAMDEAMVEVLGLSEVRWNQSRRVKILSDFSACVNFFLVSPSKSTKISINTVPAPVLFATCYVNAISDKQSVPVSGIRLF
jgi:hypothetical protein